MKKRIVVLFFAVIIMIGVCGCMNMNKTLSRTENDQEYAQLMLNHMEATYGTSFQVVESIFPEAGINSGMSENVLTLQDPSGIITNVTAAMGTPYKFYDDYANALGAAQIRSTLYLSELQKWGNVQLYTSLKTRDISNIDASPSGVSSVTLVANIPQPHSEEAMKALYDVYCQICSAGYQKLYMIAWFTDGSAEFDRAVNNYRIHGKSDWLNYNGTVHAALKITVADLDYDDFQAALVEN